MSGSLYKAQDNKIHRFTARWDIRRTKDNKLLNFDMESGYKFNHLMKDKKKILIALIYFFCIYQVS